MTARRADARLLEIEQLDNGMRAVFVPSDANNIVAIAAFIPLPSAIERPEEAGLIQFTHKMLMRGTARRTSYEVAEAIESLGTSIGSEAADDFSHAHLICTTETFEQSFPLLAEVLQNPSFEPEELEKERHSTIAAIRRSDDDKFHYTLKNFLRELYGPHSYGLPRSGMVETVSEFRREQLTHIHSEFFHPDQFLIVCVGNFSPVSARRLLESHFKSEESTGEAYAVPPVEKTPPARKKLSRDCEQAFLAMGCHACSVLSPDFAAVRVLNAVLGEGMSSRLFVRLRDEQGLAYATGSSFSAMRQGGHLFGYIGTKPESLDTAREGMAEEFEKMKQDLVPDDELARAKNYIVGKFLIDHQTNYKRAYYLGFYETMGLGMTMDEQYPQMIAAVSAQDVRAAAQKYLNDFTVVELVPQDIDAEAGRTA